MSLHLFEDLLENDLRLLLAYESGAVALFVTADVWQKTVEGKSWHKLWSVKMHVESGWFLCSFFPRRFHLTHERYSDGNVCG